MVPKTIVELIMGIVVVILVIVAVALLFGNQILDFFKGLGGVAEQGTSGTSQQGGQASGGTPEASKPKRLCEDCPGGIACKQEDCTKISNELKPFSKKCDYTSTYIFGISISNICKTVKLAK